MKYFVKAIARVLSELFPRAKGRSSSIVVPGSREGEEFRFNFKDYELGKLKVTYVVDDGNSLQYWRKIAVAGATPQEIAKEIVESIKEMPEKHRDLYQRYEKQRQELAAAA